MKVLYLTGIPSPYRVSFFNKLAQVVDLHVLFEKNKADFRNDKWQNLNDIQFSYNILNGIKTSHSSTLSFQVLKQVNENKYDIIILHGYSSPTALLLSVYLKLRKISFGIESDGMIKREDSLLKGIIKKNVLRAANYHLCPGKETMDVLKKYGVIEDNIFVYPFTSISESEILPVPKCSAEKQKLREKHGIYYDKVLLCVGMMSKGNGYRKGYDTLIKAASKINENIGVYFVGEAPTNEYIQLVDKQGAKNVHFLGFKSKTELAEYYQMSDIFVLLTRYDIWGLVINEAMANGLPIITTTNCVAGKELVKDDINGYLISPESEEQFINIVNDLIHNEDKIHSMGYSALDTIKNYTIEKMTDAHVEIFNKII